MSARAGAQGAMVLHEASNAQGSMTIELRGSNVVLITVNGHTDSAMGKRLGAVLDERLRIAAHHVFVDGENLTGYHSDLRKEGTRVLVTHQSSTRSLHVLARSKMVQMGVAVAKLVLPKLEHHTDRGKFLHALNAALADG